MLKLQDLFDLEKLQKVIDDLSKFTGLACAINDKDDNVIVKSEWQTICNQFHRANKEAEKACIKSNFLLRNKIIKGQATAEVCLHGLVDFAIPIIINNEYLGAFYIGQFFRQKPDLEFYKKQADLYGFDEAQYIRAVKKVPILNTQQEEQLFKFCGSFIEVIFELGLSKFKQLEDNKRIQLANQELKHNIEQLEALNAEYEEIKDQLSESLNSLQVSELKYRQLVDNINDGITMVDENEVFIFANSAADRIFGVPSGKLVGRSLKDFTDIDTFFELCKKTELRKKGISDSYEMNIIRPDGTKKSLLCRVSPRFDANGKFIGTFSALSDITDIKKYEEEIIKQKEELTAVNEELVSVMEELQASNNELTESQAQLQNSLEIIQESEKAFKLIFNNSPVMLVITTEDGLITDVNDTWLQFFGYQRSDVIGKPISFNIDPTTNDNIFKEIVPINWGETQSFSHNIKFQNIHGKSFDTSVKGIITTDSKGKWIGLFSVYDLTPIKRYEAEIKRLATFPELNPFYVMEIDAEGTVLYCNPATRSLINELGIDVQQVVELFFPMGISQIFEENKSSEKNIFHNEIKVKEKTISVTAYITKEFQSIRLFAEDITERKRIESALKASEAKFEELFRIMPNIVVISSLHDGKYLEVNNEFCRVMNLPREEIIGKTSKELNIWTNYEDRNRLLSILNEQGIVLNENATFNIGNKQMSAVISMVKITHQEQECLLSVVMDITRQKEIETALFQSQLQLRQIIDNIPFFVWLKDVNGKHLEANCFYAESLKLKREDIIGKTDFDLVPYEYAEKYHKQDLYIINNRQRITLEEHWDDTQDTWFEIIKAPIIDDNNQVIAITGIARDISDRKKFELRQKLNTARMESLLALNQMINADLATICNFALNEAVRLTNSHLGFLFFINDNKIDFDKCFWSSEVLKICEIEYPYHFTLEDGGIWANCVRQRRPFICNDYQNATFQEGKRGQPDKHIKITRFLSAPVFDGEDIVAIAGVGNKNSDYDESDALQLTLLLNGMWELLQHKQAIESLKSSQARLRALLDSLPHLVWIKDKFGRFLDVNEAFARKHNCSVQELIGKTDYDLYPKEQAEHYIVNDQEVILHGSKTFIEEKIDENGQKSWYETYKAPIYSSDGTVEGTIGISLDITDKKLTEIEKERFNREMLHTQKLESLGIMAGSIAHNFNNLLVGVLGNTDLILQDLPQESSIREGLERIKQAAIKSAEFTNQLLVYSGKGVLEKKFINLNNLIKEMISLIEVSIPKKVKLNLNLDPNLSLINGDSIQLNQLIMNLVTNASEAIVNKEGEITINTGTIEINNKNISDHTIIYPPKLGTYAFIEVIDTGCGMTPEQLKRIFEPFYTTKFTGRGLGLAAVQGIVKSHNGALEVKSVPNVGTTFKVYFPVAEKVEHATSESKANANLGVLEGSTILIADDEEHVLAVLSRMLSRKNVKVFTAKDGYEAIEKFKENLETIDLVILDVTMPRLDGHETFIELRKLNPKIKVILTSGFSEKEATEWFVGKGLNGFVQKPFQLDTMLEKIISVISTSCEPDK